MLAPGDVFAGHLIDAHAGGAVYRAIDTASERTVALQAGRRSPRRPFAHPNVVEVFATGDGLGDDALGLRPDARAPTAGLEPAIARPGRGRARAAHAAGIVHGNLKPSNVLLEGDHAYLSDFSGDRHRGRRPRNRGAWPLCA